MDTLVTSDRFKMVIKCITNILPFNGDKNNLSNFLERIEILIPIIETFDVTHKKIILGYIQDRITGNARNSLLSHGQPDTWADIKSVLIKSHGENTAVNVLLDKLILSRCNDTIVGFFNKINDLVIRINNSHQLGGSATAETTASTLRIALKTFSENLPEPIRGILINRNPTTLHDAYKIIASNGYLYFTGTQNRFGQFTGYNGSYGRKSGPNFNGSLNSNNYGRYSGPNNNRNSYVANYGRNSGPNNSGHSNLTAGGRITSPGDNGNHNFNNNGNVAQTYRQRNSNDHYRHGQNYTDQVRRSGQNRQNNHGVEPMDISANEGAAGEQNFRLEPSNNYLT